MGRRVRRYIIFFSTLAIFLGTFGAIGVWLYQRVEGGLTNLQLEAPEDLQSAVIAAYLSANQDRIEQPAGSDPAPIDFTINPGEGLNSIANRLERLGLIGDTELFRRYLQYNGLDTGIEAGDFTLSLTMNIPQIGSSLQSGRREELRVTIPEGRRIEEVAEIVASQIEPIDAGEFLALASDAASWQAQFPFLSDVPAGGSLEGFLFPDTYRLPLETNASDLIERMLQNFDRKITPQMQSDAQVAGLSLWDVARLASIVEREAVVSVERPLIASVYLNRLDAGWALDADPTIQYALGLSREPGNWWPDLTIEDYQGIDSPYNAYRNPGLPPSPIANAGFGSLDAVIYPTPSEFFFFRASCSQDGTHQFAVTLEQQTGNQCP